MVYIHCVVIVYGQTSTIILISNYDLFQSDFMIYDILPEIVLVFNKDMIEQLNSVH